MTRILPLLLALTLTGCPDPVTPHTGDPPTCAVACQHARDLGCAVGTPTPRGATCDTVCESAEAHGIDFRGCVGWATRCSDTESCK